MPKTGGAGRRADSCRACRAARTAHHRTANVSPCNVPSTVVLPFPLARAEMLSLVANRGTCNILPAGHGELEHGGRRFDKVLLLFLSRAAKGGVSERGARSVEVEWEGGRQGGRRAKGWWLGRGQECCGPIDGALWVEVCVRCAGVCLVKC